MISDKIPSTPILALKQRNSSVELYRIIATFTVLIVHFNGWFVGGMPEKLDLASPSVFRISQAIIESATCICVNMFLIISGYFGIRLKWSSVFRICLLLLFIYVPSYIFQSILSDSFGIKILISQFFIITRAGYFVQCYLMLMFLSPVLNAFVEKNRKDVLIWTIAFAVIEFYFGDFRQLECLGFGGGYSVMHFVLMYMIARCLNLYKESLMRLPAMLWLGGYLVCTLLILFQYVLGVKWTYSYANPIVIASTVCSFMPFLYYNYHNSIINWIAASTFAVYIIQVTDPCYTLLVRLDNHLLTSQTYILYLLYALGVIILFFLLCIVYDKLCQMFIKPIIRILPFK